MTLTILCFLIVLLGCASTSEQQAGREIVEPDSDGSATDSIGSGESGSRDSAEGPAVPPETVTDEEAPAVSGLSSEGGRAGSERKTDDTEPAFVEEESTGVDDGPGAGSAAKGESAEATGAVSEGERSTTGSGGRRPPAAEASGLKAGFADDNMQFGYFINFLEQYGDVPHFELPVQERIIIAVADASGKSVPNAEVAVWYGQDKLVEGLTLADGTYQFNPSEFDASAERYRATVRYGNAGRELTFDRSGDRTQNVRLDVQRRIPQDVPVDLLFIFDTTGSMGEEIHRLKTTIELIHLNLTSLSFQPDIRFGMVLYKDMWDEYRTEVIPLTSSLDAFQEALAKVSASGGGDTPEDLQAALEQSMTSVDWNRDGIRLAFVITDAPPHLDYDQEFTYVDASRSAREQAIKIFTVGTSGLDIVGEYILRQISQYTAGKYIFLTYGETGESEGGRPGSVSHHTGSNFQTDKLEAIIIRFAKEEISYLTDQPLDIDEPYFEAVKIVEEEREETLHTLFTMAIDQLLDFATIRIERDTAAAILPIEAATEGVELDAEYFSERITMAGAESSRFTLVERKDMQKIIDEMKLQLSGITDDENVTKIGELLNAELLISGSLYEREGYELFLKLLRVESGEVLSVTRAKIDSRLGL